jgi:hypothetical protein
LPGLTTLNRSGRTFRRAGWPSGGSALGAATIDGSAYTKRGPQETLRRSTRERNGATRGVNTLTSPARAVRASSAKRRLPGNTSAKYRRTVGSGRAGAWRKSPRMGQRISSGRISRRGSASSGLHGATRARRGAR